MGSLFFKKSPVSMHWGFFVGHPMACPGNGQRHIQEATRHFLHIGNIPGMPAAFISGMPWRAPAIIK